MSEQRQSFRLVHCAALFLVLAILAAGTAVLWRSTSGSRTANVILITIDTLRADHLGAYGYPLATSPNFDAFAKEGVLFRRAFSAAPETNVSLSSLMSSMYPHETKVLRNFSMLPPAVTTLAELLQGKGWRTAAVVSNYSLRRGSGFEQGFEEYDDRMEDPGEPTWEGVERVGPKTAAAAIEWLRHHHQERFFLWVHFMDPHAPYTPPSPYNSMFTDSLLGEHKELPVLERKSFTAGRNLGGIPYNARLGSHTDAHYYVAEYDGEIRFLDESLGELLRETRALGLMDNSLVIVTADHGEGMGEHNFFFNHTELVFTGLIHVPLVVRLPGPARQGRRIDEPVGLIDVLPTVLAVLGLDAPKGIKGHTLMDPQSKPIFSATSFATGHVTLIQNGRKLLSDEGRLTFYDLDHDFYETRDLLERGSPEDLLTARQMKETMTSIAEQDDLHLGPPVNWAVVPEVKERLRALGYVQ